MADPIGAISSNENKLAALKKPRMHNPAEKAQEKRVGAFLAADFTKRGQVPGYNDVSIHTQA